MHIYICVMYTCLYIRSHTNTEDCFTARGRRTLYLQDSGHAQTIWQQKKKGSQTCFFYVQIFLSWRRGLPEPFKDRGGGRETISEKIMSPWNHCLREKQELSQSFSLRVGVESWLEAFSWWYIFPYLQTYCSVKNKYHVWSFHLLLLCGQLTSLVQCPCCTGIWQAMVLGTFWCCLWIEFVDATMFPREISPTPDVPHNLGQDLIFKREFLQGEATKSSQCQKPPPWKLVSELSVDLLLSDHWM